MSGQADPFHLGRTNIVNPLGGATGVTGLGATPHATWRVAGGSPRATRVIGDAGVSTYSPHVRHISPYRIADNASPEIRTHVLNQTAPLSSYRVN